MTVIILNRVYRQTSSGITGGSQHRMNKASQIVTKQRLKNVRACDKTKNNL